MTAQPKFRVGDRVKDSNTGAVGTVEAIEGMVATVHSTSLGEMDLLVEYLTLLATPALDPVNHPPHYNRGKIEALDFIEDQGFDYLDGNVIKYMVRYRWKGAPLDDLKKARFYQDRQIAAIETGGGE